MRIVKIRKRDYAYPDDMLRRIGAIYSDTLGMPQVVYWCEKDLKKMEKALLQRAKKELKGSYYNKRDVHFIVAGTIMDIGPNIIKGNHFPEGYMLINDVELLRNKQRLATEYEINL